MLFISWIIIVDSIFLGFHVDAVNNEHDSLRNRTKRSSNSYRKIFSGSCSSNGMQPINTFQECNAAALAIGNPDKTASEAFNSNRPEGCYDNGNLWLATNPVNKGNGADSSRQPICKIADWTKEEPKFCRNCSAFYQTYEEAISACTNDLNCAAVYDLFCDGIGPFCTCKGLFAIEQPHPKGMDCIYRKQ